MRLLSKKHSKGKKRKASMFKSVICNNDIENLNLNYILNKRVTDMDFFIQRKKNCEF